MPSDSKKRKRKVSSSSYESIDKKRAKKEKKKLKKKLKKEKKNLKKERKLLKHEDNVELSKDLKSKKTSKKKS